MTVTLELADDIDEVFEDARPGDPPVLRHMTDEEHRQCPLLRHADEGCRHRAHLCHPTRASLDLRGLDRLHRVDDEERGVRRLDVAEECAEVRVVGEEERGVESADAFRATTHLGGGLLPRDVEDGPLVGPTCLLGRPRRDVEQEGPFARHSGYKESWPSREVSRVAFLLLWRGFRGAGYTTVPVGLILCFRCDDAGKWWSELLWVNFDLGHGLLV